MDEEGPLSRSRSDLDLATVRPGSKESWIFFSGMALLPSSNSDLVMGEKFCHYTTPSPHLKEPKFR